MELNLEQIKLLEDLMTHEGWIIYQKLLLEKLDDALVDLRNSKDWPDYVETRGMANLIELDIIPLVSTTLEEWREEHSISALEEE